MCSMAYSKLESFLTRCLTKEITLHEIQEAEAIESISNMGKILDVILIATEEEKKIFQLAHFHHCIDMVKAFITRKKLHLFFCDFLKGQNKDVQGKIKILRIVQV